MKKLVSIILLFAMVFTIAACNRTVDPVTEPTAEPAITTPDCAEPTAEPTVEPTVEPTAAPEPVDLDFRLCGEEIARISMGSGELDAHIEREGGVWVPEHYCVSDGKLYICNGSAENGAKISILICDLESGSVENRLFGSEYFIHTEFAVKDGKLMTPDFIFDLETGEVKSLQRLIPEGGRDEIQRVIAMRVINGKCCAYVGDSMDPFLSRAIDEYELDEAGLMWKLMRRVTEPAGENGFKAGDAEFSIGEYRFFSNPTGQDDVLISGRYMGTNSEGEHFVNYRYQDEEELGREFDAVTRFSADGTPISRVKIDSTALYNQDNCRLFNMDGDGNVYFMAEDDEHLTVYRVGTEIRAYELAFDSCAELALRLPWGDGETDVFIERPIGGYEDEDWVIPQHFNIIDGKVFILDRHFYYGHGVLECDPATGGVTRLSPDIGEYDFFNSEFAILDGKVIFARYMFDLDTGERTELQPISDYWDFPREGILIMSVRDGRCFAYKAVGETDQHGNQVIYVPDTHEYDEYELDMENRMWVLKRRIELPGSIPHASPDLPEGSEFYCYDRYMGMDDAGNHYVDSYECILDYDAEGAFRGSTVWNRIIKFSPDGRPISCVDVYFPDNYIRMWIDENYLIFKVDGDGTVWYMCETEDEFLIYKIVL